MRKPVENFAKDIAPADAAGRLDAPAFHRNKDALSETLCELLAGRTGDVLELGSGTGQHAVTFAAAMPAVSFWPTDPVEEHVSSIDAWRIASGLANVKPASRLDSRDPDWQVGGNAVALGTLCAIVAINVIHIAPWAVADAALSGAAKYLSADGLMIFYGPYKKGGQHTSEGNAEFDEALRARNPAFGVRDREALTQSAAAVGLKLVREIEMPANNTVLVYMR